VNRRGLTLIELMVTMTLLGILANLGVPAYGELRRRAEATRVIGDIGAIRVAVMEHYVEYQTYPASGPWGAAPPTLVASLPQGFEWHWRDVEYRWERWSLPNGLPTNPSQTVLVGVTVRTTDAVLLAALRGLYKGHVAFGTPTQITFVLE
jgi:prepilin-type N-terminal cleavage/methylation domain-containing protein